MSSSSESTNPMSNHRKSLLSAIRKSDSAFISRLREEGEELSADTETFRDVQLVELKLGGIDLSNTEWDECSLDRVDFSDANLEGAYLKGCMLLGCTFRNTNLDGASLEGCILRNCVIEGASVEGLEMGDLQFADSTLAELELNDIDWRSVSMNDGRISGLRGVSGSISGMTLRQVAIESFDTGGLTIEHSTTTPLDKGEAPAGFTVREGRRRKV